MPLILMNVSVVEEQGIGLEIALKTEVAEDAQEEVEVVEEEVEVEDIDLDLERGRGIAEAEAAQIQGGGDLPLVQGLVKAEGIDLVLN